MYNLYIKRFFDLIFALLLLFLLSPVMISCALLIKIEDPQGPILFKQSRLGKNNTPFNVRKFRSMKIARFEDNRELSDEERMLKTGYYLRKLSLDELPQLINVIIGDMSFIGPRPLPIVYYPYYTEDELGRHAIKPGISGLAQVNGRNNLSWEEKFKYDLQYRDSLNIITDISILYLTICKVFKRSDIKVRKRNQIDGSLDEIREPLRNSIVEINGKY